MLALHIYDTTAVPERLFCAAAAIAGTAGTVDGTAAISTKLKALNEHIIDVDRILDPTSRLRSRL